MSGLFAETVEERLLRAARTKGKGLPEGKAKARATKKSHRGRSPGVSRRWDRQRNRASQTGVLDSPSDNPMAAENPTFGDRAEIVDPATGKLEGFRINTK